MFRRVTAGTELSVLELSEGVGISVPWYPDFTRIVLGHFKQNESTSFQIKDWMLQFCYVSSFHDIFHFLDRYSREVTANS